MMSRKALGGLALGTRKPSKTAGAGKSNNTNYKPENRTWYGAPSLYKDIGGRGKAIDDAVSGKKK